MIEDAGAIKLEFLGRWFLHVNW